MRCSHLSYDPSPQTWIQSQHYLPRRAMTHCRFSSCGFAKPKELKGPNAHDIPVQLLKDGT